MRPLFVKYRTDSGQEHLYDLGTGWIIDIDSTIGEIVQDYGILTKEEIVQKYDRLGRENVLTALRELGELQEKKFLPDHSPEEIAKINQIQFDNKRYEIEDFWQSHASLLILCLTERCNLCCSYCCYSGNFVGQRRHSNRSMSREIAEKAILDYLGNEPVEESYYSITFYGGEPLLEFDLLRDMVLFADDLAKKKGKEIRYSITTNGTLLDDEKIDFFVEHQFMVQVSFDGPKRMHDRYRVFRNGTGSFDIVEKNLRRFVERYPDYRYRGFLATLVPPLELEETRVFLEEFYSHYMLSRISLVNTGVEARFMDNPVSSTRYGCYSASACEPQFPTDAFRQFSEKEGAELGQMRSKWIESVKKYGLWETKKLMPLATMLFEQAVSSIHGRPVTTRKPKWPILAPCFPGFTRRFCDVEGNYRVCERVDESETFKLGNVQTGLNHEKLERLMELRRAFGDCANCTAQKTCDICYARIPNSDDDASGFDPMFDLQCQRTRQALPAQLKMYTEIMEVNPNAFNIPGSNAKSSRLESLRYCVLSKQMSDETDERIQYESF